MAASQRRSSGPICTAALVACVLLVLVAGGASAWMIGGLSRTPERHVLREPIIVYGRTGLGLLPAGTMLTLDRRMPEGFDRFSLTVNVHGVVLPVSQTGDPTLVDPLSSHPVPSRELTESGRLVNDDDLVDILRSLRVRRDDVDRIRQRLE